MTFETQLQTCYQDLVCFARALAGTGDEGDDLLQDALLKAWQGYSRLRDPGRFRAWALSIITNTHRSRLRRQRWRHWLSLEAVRSLAVPQDMGYEDRRMIREALHRLPLEQQEALVLHEVVGLSVEEIAGVQHVSASGVKSRLARGRSRLRRLLAPRAAARTPQLRPVASVPPVESLAPSRARR